MRNIWISDITISQSGTREGFALSFREKIELAKLLDKVGVTVIETGHIENRRTDSLLIKSLASAVKHSALAVPVVLGDPESVELTWNALDMPLVPAPKKKSTRRRAPSRRRTAP